MLFFGGKVDCIIKESSNANASIKTDLERIKE